MPKTRGSELQRRLQGAEERLSVLGTGRVRYCEQTGVTVRQMVQRNNPWGGLPCSQAGSTGPHGDQVGCLPCSGDNETKQNCTKRSSVYETTCLSCDKKAQENESRGLVGLRVKYCGTTHGSQRRRGQEHLRDLKAGLEDKLGEKTSHMFIHLRESHPGENPRPRWGMKMIKTYTSTFKRLLGELVHIKYLAKDPNIELLNKKCGGYQGYSLPRLSVQDGAEEDGQSAQTQENVNTSNNEDRDLTTRVNISIPFEARKRARHKVKLKTS